MYCLVTSMSPYRQNKSVIAIKDPQMNEFSNISWRVTFSRDDMMIGVSY